MNTDNFEAQNAQTDPFSELCVVKICFHHNQFPAQLQNTNSHSQEGTYFSWNAFFFFWSIEFDCRVSSSTQTAACLVEPAGRGPAAVPQRNGGERTKRKSIHATLVQSINYLQCHVVRGCRNEKTLQTVPKFTPQKDDVTLLCHDSTTQLTVGEKRIWMSPTSTRSTFILKVDIDVRMLSDEVAQFRLIATSTQDHLWLPVIS